MTVMHSVRVFPPRLRSCILPFAVFALSVLCGTWPAPAQDKASPLPSHLPLGTEACFGRNYDAAHLAKHPQQRVTGFHLFRDFTPDPSKETPQSTPEQLKSEDGDGGIHVTAFVRLRDRPGLFWNALECRKSESGVRCGIECDGGGFKLRTAGQSLMADNEGFVVIGGCGASEDEQEQADFVHPGADDKVFRLDPKPVAECRALEDSRKPAWAKLGPPIRERLARDGEVCFARSYDAAHLARHPKQKVRRFAVLKAADARADNPDWPSYELTFRIETRDGKRYEKKTNCSVDNYAFACTHDPQLEMQRDFYFTRAGADAIMLRDRRGTLEELFDASLGSDDQLFRLHDSPPGACNF
jgi:hypothetical protein